MFRGGVIFLFTVLVPIVAMSQLQNSYTVENDNNVDRVKFILTTTNGQCSIEPALEDYLMNIYNISEEGILPDFQEEIIGRTKQVDVRLEDKESGYLSSTISKRFFSKQSLDDFTWKVYLSKIKPLDLNLIYAVGDAYIDLSGLPVERLKMNTGSANVHIDYKNDMGNQISMDTFMVKVDMGSLNARNMYLSGAKHIIADVGFGKMRMDFSKAEQFSTDVKAVVGAGKLEVLVPENEISIKINVNDSPLCRIVVPENFTKLNDNVFVSHNYDPHAPNTINFNVDVAVGNITFKSVSH